MISQKQSTRPPGRAMTIAAFFVIIASAFSSLLHADDGAPPGLNTMTSQGHISVADFLPPGYVADGSISYQAEIQQALDAAVGRGATVLFPPMVYAVDETGFRIGSRMTLSLYGAVFQVADSCKNDGQVFWGENVTDVRIFGGEIAGRNDVRAEGVNIRGVRLSGAVQRIRIRDMSIHDLSSNGIGVFAAADSMASDIWVTDVIVDNCCNRYGDYLGERVGPEPGSVREDQGSIAFYYVRDFLVRGCRFERSRSDGTHFYRCKQGQIVDNNILYTTSGQIAAIRVDAAVVQGVVIRDNLLRRENKDILVENENDGGVILRGNK